MLEFTKMQGLGNDFICVDYDKVSRYNLSIFSKYVCDRHFGIGADGVILYSKSKIADCKMRIFNSDGTEANMCGNGIRCLARLMYENGYINKNKMKILYRHVIYRNFQKKFFYDMNIFLALNKIYTNSNNSNNAPALIRSNKIILKKPK